MQREQRNSSRKMRKPVSSTTWEFGQTRGGWGKTEFMSHYNKKLDRCFISIKGSYHPRGKRYTYYVNGVFDVFEGTTLGEIDIHIPPETYDPFICHVGNKGCKSSEEFEALIKPYMEE